MTFAVLEFPTISTHDFFTFNAFNDYFFALIIFLAAALQEQAMEGKQKFGANRLSAAIFVSFYDMKNFKLL